MNQGLKLLAIQAQKHGVKLKERHHLVLLPLFAFLDQLLSSLRKFVSSTRATCSWAEFLAMSLNDQQFSNIYASWLQHNLSSLQCKLLSTLLSCASISKINTFLKLRKLVLKLKPESNKNLDIIQLQHEDIIGILHSAYKNPESKKKIAEGVKNLFISYHMQQAKICSCVFIEYALSLHNEFHVRENNEATVAHQSQQFGTIPQSILGYSSIISHSSRAFNQNQGQNLGHSNQRNSKVNNNGGRSINTSQYVSNFQSIIHDENGLYRKMKSSQVSLQGFRVIDHKFYNNYGKSASREKSRSNSKSNENNHSLPKEHESMKKRVESMPSSQIYKPNPQKSQSINNSNYGSYHNRSYNEGLRPIQESPGEQRYSMMNQSKNSNSPQNNSNQFERGNAKNEQYGSPSRDYHPVKVKTKHENQNESIEQEFSSGKRRGIEVATLEMRNSNYKAMNQFKNQQNSPSYSQRFKSPDMSYGLTSDSKINTRERQAIGRGPGNVDNHQNDMSSSVVKRLNYPENPINSSIHESQRARPVINPIKIQEANSDRDQYNALRNDKQSGYEMWKRLTQRNRSFMQRMLRPDLDRIRTHEQSRSRSRDSDSPLEPEHSPNYSQIRQIHDSTIKRSNMSQWNNPIMTDSHE